MPSPLQATGDELELSSGIQLAPQRIVVYGTGGIGKTELVVNAKEVGVRPLIIDLEDRTKSFNVDRYKPTTFQGVRALLQDDERMGPFDLISIDTGSKLEELAATHICQTIKNEKGFNVDRLSQYSFGKGNELLFESFLLILGDLDRLVRKGKHVVVVCHECVTPAPNPFGEEWIRYEPRANTTTKGTFSVRNKLKDWTDHMFFVSYDVAVSKDGKGQGSGTRTIHATEMPTHWAKSQSISEPIPYEKGSSELWKQLFNKE